MEPVSSEINIKYRIHIHIADATPTAHNELINRSLCVTIVVSELCQVV